MIAPLWRQMKFLRVPSSLARRQPKDPPLASGSLAQANLHHSPFPSNSSDIGDLKQPPAPNRLTESAGPLTRAGVTSFQENPHTGTMPAANGSPTHDLEREYLEALCELKGLQNNSQTVSLAKYNNPHEILPHVRKQLQFAGINVNDLDRLNAIHVTGTKGKGSTCIFIESILLANTLQTDAGGGRRPLRVGCYTSPHLIHVTERIRLDGRPIDRELFVRNFWHIFGMLKAGAEREQLAMPNYFTFLTILAFYTFLKEQVDCAIVEVGIGGEFDPTNVLLKPVACAITTLDLDHTGILGPTLKSIAWTKAGIIKSDAPMFTVEHDEVEATEMIKARALRSNSSVFICKPLEITHDKQLGIDGVVQATNASVACELASCLLNRLDNDARSQDDGSQPLGLPIGFTSQGIKCDELPESFRRGLERAQLPGRCQIVHCDQVSFFIDGAHTKKSVQNCLEWFYRSSIRDASLDYPYRYLMINIIGERDRREVLEPLVMYCKLFRKVIFTSNRLDVAQTQDKLDSNTSSPPQLPHHEESLENAINNSKVWSDRIKELPDLPEAEVHATISESLQVILHDYASAVGSRNLQSHKVTRPHILATGSLHFTGAVLEIIERFRSD